MHKVGIVSLGCAKNRVDTEEMLGILSEKGFEIVQNTEDADVIIVNTCAFINDAKEEAIETILEMAEYKKKNVKCLIVAGCLSERYREEILTEFPEVDFVVGTGDFYRIDEAVLSALSGERGMFFENSLQKIPDGLPRMVSTGEKTAYLKIAEGCDNNCTYCIIPKLRGRYISRPFETIVQEAENLARLGYEELIIIAQDTTRYGYDLYGKERLSELLTRLSEIKGIKWLRVHYMYPESITDSMIKAIKESGKIANYFDIPIQHIKDDVLKRMGRKTTKAEITALIKKLRTEIPDVTLRTSLIVGFPGETEDDFNELLDFIQWAKFDRLGIFAYSKEEGTAAEKLKGHLPDTVKQERKQKAELAQGEILRDIQSQKIKTTVTVLTEGYDEESFLYYGRTQNDSPEVDTVTYFAAKEEIEIGSFIKVNILTADDFDTTGEQVL